jgi:uncharacterized membrane protein
MNDTPAQPRTDDGFDDTSKAIAVYVIYIAALVTALPFFIGVILAYIMRSDAPAWARSHFDHQIGLFWRFVIASIVLIAVLWIAIPLSFVIIGIPFVILVGLLFVYLWVWLLIRCLKGIGDARRAMPYQGRRGFLP